MIREILFRGRNLYPNAEEKWVYAIPVPIWCNTYEGDRVEMVKYHAYDELEVGCEFSSEDCEVDPKTIGQFTGLVDKNGTKIFEGDIIDATGQWRDAYGFAGYDSPIIEVKFDPETCGFAPFSVYDCGVFIEATGCEVIGNVHDNPELLEKEQE